MRIAVMAKLRHVAPVLAALLVCSRFRRTAAFGASGCQQSVTCDAVIRTGKDATAIGFQSSATGLVSTAMGFHTSASGDGSTAMGLGTNASGDSATAVGYQTNASGLHATSMGLGTVASGDSSTSMGSATVASGDISTAMGYQTNASGLLSTAMGYGIEASEDEALVNSGTIHGKSLGFVADQRLAADVRPAHPPAMLAAVTSLKVVTHAPSANYCAHQNRTALDCAQSRSTKLLAQQVAAVLPGAVSAPSSLTLTKSRWSRAPTEHSTRQ